MTGGAANNVIPITVNGALCSANSYLNKPCVSVTVCTPGTSTCQTIDDILLDTGSYGLRIFKQALTVSLPQVTGAAGLDCRVRPVRRRLVAVGARSDGGCHPGE